MKDATRTFSAFNTSNTIHIAGFEGNAEAVLDKAEQLCHTFHDLFNHADPQSELNRLNNAQGTRVELPQPLIDLLQHALTYCKQTNGIFDITVGPQVALWDFRNGIVPNENALKQATKHVGWRNIHIEDRCAQLKNSHARIVLGGIAKGYAADAVCELLRAQGVSHAVVNLGGNVKVMGGKPNGQAWRIGIRAPISTRQANEKSLGHVEVFDGAVVTSGIYERCFTDKDGRIYHHILDPATGMPADTDIISATVLCSQSVDADAYATTCVVMGLARAQEFLKTLRNTKAIFIDSNYAIHTVGDISHIQ